jgi:putative methionine-R-sulfoxide reductase with GAF domain/HAMP domain-containing protein
MRLFGFLRHWSLGLKLMTGAFLALLTLLTAANVISTAGIRRFSTLAGQSRVAQEAVVIQNRLEQAEQDVLAATKLLASRPGLAEAVANQDVDTVRMITSIDAVPLDLDEVAVIEPDSAYLATMTEEKEFLPPMGQTSLIAQAQLGADTTGAIVNADETMLWLGAAIPLRDANDTIVGVLMAAHQVDDRFLETLDFDRQDIHLALVTGGHILAQDFPSPELLGETSAALLNQSAIERAMAGQTLVADDLLSSSDGTAYALAHAPLIVQGKIVTTLGILYDLGQLRVFERQLTRTINIVFTMLATVVLSAVGVFTRLGITNPLRRLTSVAQRMAAGDYTQRAEVVTTDEVGQLGQAFNEMATELQQTLGGLERRVSDRTRALETSSQIGRRLSTILDREQLVAEVVRQVQEAFNYYCVHIYLLDDTTQDLVMAGGTGAAGRVMLADGHRISQGRGLIGRAAMTNTTVLVPDVKQNANWLPNPLLPDTRAEIAVPISTGERLLGVLDVQHNVTNGLSDDDADMLASIANQVAVALQNTRLYAEAQKHARYEERVNLINQRIQNTTTVEEALQVSIRELGRILGTETSVHLDAAPGSGNDRDMLALMAHDQPEVSS